MTTPDYMPTFTEEQGAAPDLLTSQET